MGAEQSQPQAAPLSPGGPIAAKETLLSRASVALDISVEDVEALLKKLGPSVARTPGEMLHCTCRGLLDYDIAALGALAVLQPSGLDGLVSINLAHNSIGDEGAAALGRALASGSPTLQRLQLHENRIGDAGVAAIARAMVPGGAPNVQVLRLDFNRIGDEGIAALAQQWAEGGACELRELFATGNEVTSVGLAALALQLPNVPQLRHLGFGSSSGGNRIGDDGCARGGCAPARSSRAARRVPRCACLDVRRAAPSRPDGAFFAARSAAACARSCARCATSRRASTACSPST